MTDLDTNARPVPSVMALTGLKLCLGLAGRADFMTESKIWPGDLIYPDEQVSVFVLSCFWNGCQKHRFDSQIWTPLTKNKIATNVRAMAEMTKWLDRRGWARVRMYECEVRADPEAASQKVIALLESRRKVTGRMVTNFGPLDLAHLARLDAGSRVSDTAWRTFVRWMGDTTTKKAKVLRSTKWEAEQYFTSEHGWTAPAFKEIWKCALHHEVIMPNNSSQCATKGGPLLEAALADCGFTKEEKKK